MLRGHAHSHLSFSTFFKSMYWNKFDSLFIDSIISLEDSTILDNYWHEISSETQPVQIRYFNSNGEPIFKMVNCDIDPVYPMTWNKHKSFDTFPPTPISRYEGQKALPLSIFLENIKNLNGDTVRFEDLPKSDYYAVVFWNSFWIRPTKRLFKRLKSYVKKFDQDTYFIYVNNHNAEIWSALNAEQRRELKDSLEIN